LFRFVESELSRPLGFRHLLVLPLINLITGNPLAPALNTQNPPFQFAGSRGSCLAINHWVWYGASMARPLRIEFLVAVYHVNPSTPRPKGRGLLRVNPEQAPSPRLQRRDLTRPNGSPPLIKTYGLNNLKHHFKSFSDFYWKFAYFLILLK